MRGDIGDVGAAYTLVERVHAILQVCRVVRLPARALVLPEMPRHLAPILIVLKRGLTLQGTAKAGFAKAIHITSSFVPFLFMHV